MQPAFWDLCLCGKIITIIGTRLKNDTYPDGLIYDMQEPYHYFRTHKIGGRKYLIAGGNDHKTGHENPQKAFANLEKYLRKHFPIDTVKYKWSSQYYIPVDGFPYTGKLPGTASTIFCATGFNGNGMMLGTLSAKIIADIITGKGNPYEVFSPSRIKPLSGLKEFVTENADAVWHFVVDRFGPDQLHSLKKIPNDSGKVIEYKGKKMAVYKDADGEIHALQAVCTHAKCIVQWNGSEKSRDCPCHGARYSVDGKVLNGPADKDLPQIIITNE